MLHSLQVERSTAAAQVFYYILNKVSTYKVMTKKAVYANIFIPIYKVSNTNVMYLP